RRPTRIDIRLICSTQSNILDLVKIGRFREDLFYRLNVFPIMLPPLRTRKIEIPDLARKFMSKFSTEEGRKVNQISNQALDLLMKYEWPGNIRQLENAIYRAVILAESEELDVTEFPQIAAGVEDFEVLIPPTPVIKPHTSEEEAVTPLTIRDPNVLPLIGANGEVRNLADIEENTIRFALYHYHGQMSEIARRLGIGRSTLYRKLKEYGIDEQDADIFTPNSSLVA
ncbi:MAG: helix-turn-helix domain-containing protein, partial [Methylocystis sp.]